MNNKNSLIILDYENWSGYRQNGGAMEPDVDIDPSLCTHIMYGFATLDSNTLLLSIFDEWADIGKSKLEILNLFYSIEFNLIKTSDAYHVLLKNIQFSFF